jgi:hypothetical protein
VALQADETGALAGVIAECAEEAEFAAVSAAAVMPVVAPVTVPAAPMPMPVASAAAALLPLASAAAAVAFDRMFSPARLWRHEAAPHRQPEIYRVDP